MTNIAILGFGVVGSGVASLIHDNIKEVSALGGDDVNIKYILDLRDFPDSPFSDRIVHDYNVILNDPEVSCVIEVMGGSHPAYEFTVSAIKSGKNVITSNKEVVAGYGDEFLALAEEYGVSYRFEASVGGGIPVISPMIGFIKQNKISEVRGILNGTTNYILTKMFTFGESFDESLREAQTRGYAERNPDADILGVDACRKISILTAIATGNLVPTEKIHTEGIVGIRSEDVRAAAKIGCTIKLVGRCIVEEGRAPFVMVAPFLIPSSEALSGVFGVYNAIEISASPLGNVMFYGQGAGAGATASAVVGDLCQIMRSGVNSAKCVFSKTDAVRDFSEFSAKRYIALDSSCKDAAKAAFENIKVISEEGEFAFITEDMTEAEAEERLSKIGASPISLIRLLG